MSPRVNGKHHDPGRVAVESLHHAERWFCTFGKRGFEESEQRLVKRSLVARRSRLRINAGRLIYDKNIWIPKENMLIGNGKDIHRLSIKIDFQTCACRYGQRTAPHTPPVQMNAAQIDDFSGKRTRKFGDSLRQELIKPHSPTFFFNCKSKDFPSHYSTSPCFQNRTFDTARMVPQSPCGLPCKFFPQKFSCR